MGFLKKITRPISRVLDKIVPNEIKPTLPFLAAAAPFMAPGIMGAFGNSMLSRGLISGGLNLGSQLAQEGSDGDFSGLSTLMAAATGALSTPGSAGGRTIGDTGKSYSQYMGGDSLASTGTQSAGDFFKNKALGMEPGLTKSGLGALETSSNYLSGVSDTLQNNLFSKEGLKAALVPVGQGMTDLAVAENRRALKDYEREQADYEAGMDEENSNRAFAIRQSMEAYGFTEQEILDAIEAAGYRAGGRVGLANGGDPGPMGNPAVVTEIDNMREFNITDPDVEDIQFQDIKETVKEVDKDKVKSDIFGLGDPELVSKVGEDINEGILSLSDIITDKDGSVYLPIQYLRKLGEDMFFGGQKNPELPEKMYDKLSDEYIEEMKKVKERGYKDGGRIGLQEGGALAPILPQASQITALTQRPLLAGLQPLQQAQAVFPRLNQLEQGVGRAEETLGRIRSRLGPEQKAQIAGFQPMLQPALGYQPLNMLNLNRGIGISALQSGPEAQGMKDGGLMNLGGKEMDMRGGGFIPIGKKEKADDVPARLSKNEFVMTADAVRAAGGGSVNEGAKRMYETMNRLEARA